MRRGGCEGVWGERGEGGGGKIERTNRSALNGIILLKVVV